jgi:hypothetical protein
MIEAILSADSFAASGKLPECTLLPGVVLLAVRDGSARLLNLDGSFSALSSTGSLMLQKVLQFSIEEAVQSICERFSVDEGSIRADLEKLLGDLERWNYILRQGSALSVKRAPTFTPIAIKAALFILSKLRNLRLQTGTLLILSWFSYRFLGWNQTISFWKEMALSFQRQPSAKLGAREIGEVIRHISARLPWKIDCKEQTLTCWFLCRQFGVSTTMVLGIMIYPLASHFWCEWEGQCLTDDPERSRRYTPIIRYET